MTNRWSRKRILEATSYIYISEAAFRTFNSISAKGVPANKSAPKDAPVTACSVPRHSGGRSSRITWLANVESVFIFSIAISSSTFPIWRRSPSALRQSSIRFAPFCLRSSMKAEQRSTSGNFLFILFSTSLGEGESDVSFVARAWFSLVLLI